MKRIIALPGERIRIEAGQVLIDDKPLDEPYCVYRLPWNILESSSGRTRCSSSATTGRCSRSTTTSAAPTADRILGRLIN